MTNNSYAGFIKFEEHISPVEITKLVERWKDHWEIKFPGTWIDLHIRSAGNDESYALAFTRQSDGTWEEGFGREVLENFRATLGRDEHGRPNGVRNWTMAGTMPIVHP